jgi:hypothetical protein
VIINKGSVEKSRLLEDETVQLKSSFERVLEIAVEGDEE